MPKEEKDGLLEEEVLKEQDLLDAEASEENQPAGQGEKDDPVQDAPSREEELEARISELEDQLLRRQAEFENYRKRTTKEKEEIGLTAKIRCISELLSCLDNFERALKTPCSDEEYKKGVEMMFSSMKESFVKQGLVEIEAEGSVFDPAVHYAVTTVENPELGSNVVASVLQKGYKIGDKVVRPAMVAVANP